MTTLRKIKRRPLGDLAPAPPAAELDPPLTVRVGCRLAYMATEPAEILLVVKPRLEAGQVMVAEKLSFRGEEGAMEFEDPLGNTIQRWTLPVGETVIVHDALVQVPPYADDFGQKRFYVPVPQIPADVLRYTLPSRYCDSDKLLLFSANLFAGIITGLDRVIAICNWVHLNINYVTGSGRPDLSASEIVARGYGVCRDFAHVAVALCRALNIPARYVTGHLPDIGCFDPGTPMGFSRVLRGVPGAPVAHVRRAFQYAADRAGEDLRTASTRWNGSFSTVYGQAALTSFEVWSYQVNPQVVSIGDPIDLSKRLDGTPQIRLV